MKLYESVLSSASFRVRIALNLKGLAYDSVVFDLRAKQHLTEEYGRVNPLRSVPALTDGGLQLIESMAICEYLAESFPTFQLWPRDHDARAVARSVCAELHSGFQALRAHLPMNIRSSFPGREIGPEVQADINRVMSIWRDCRARCGEGRGDFLFGHFTIADAMYAPVATRFRTYKIELEREADAYCDAIMAMPEIQEWITASRNEPMVVEHFEF